MRSWTHLLSLACTACIAGTLACSDDPNTDTEQNPLQGQGGAAAMGGSGGASMAMGGTSASNGGSGAQGGSSSGLAGMSGLAGSGMGGSGMGGTGMGGTGMAGSMMVGAGGADLLPDAGPVGEPDAGGEDPGGEDPGGEAVGFADVHPILVANCGDCHGNPNGFLPAFAQDDIDAAFAVTQEAGGQGQLIAERIVVRAVDLRTMPPACGGTLGMGACLGPDEAALLQDWVDQGAEP